MKPHRFPIPPRPAPAPQQGFSLLEMLVALILIASLSLAGGYSWQRWRQQQQLTQSVQQTRQFLQWLRDDANWHNRNHYIQLNQTADSWCLISTASEAADPPRCNPDAYWQLNLPFSGVKIIKMSKLAFFGLRNTARAGHIVLGNPAGERKILISDWGRIRSCDNQDSPSC